MKLTENSFKNMITTIRQVYGSSWRSDLDNDTDAQITFFRVCQAVIPNEMVNDLITNFCTHREIGPRSPYDIVSAYIDMQITDARPGDFVIDKMIEAIRNYEYNSNDSPYRTCDKYLFSNVIPMFPCSEGVKSFYLNNKTTLLRMAHYQTSEEENAHLYRDMGFDYRKRLVDTERKAIIERIDRVELPNTRQRGRLEA